MIKNRIFLGFFGLTFLFFAFGGVASSLSSQTRPQEGLREEDPRVYAFVGADIITAPGREIKGGTLLIREGVIEAVGKKVNIPADATVRQVKGLRIYPGLIDLGASFGLKSPTRNKKRDHWSPMARPHWQAGQMFQGDSAREKALRGEGFTTLLISPHKGVLRGQGMLISLAQKDLKKRILKEKVIQGVGFDTLGWAKGYPTSLMGAIALLRQTFYDGQWYQKAWKVYNSHPQGKEAPEKNPALAALKPLLEGKQQILWEIKDEWDALRASKIGGEFGLKYIFLGCGTEYRRLSVIKKIGAPLVVPIRMPQAPDVNSPERASDANLRSLRHYILAPQNPALLTRAGLKTALTTKGLKKVSHFRKAMAEVIRGGLSKREALAALTVIPAKMIGQFSIRGTLEVGKAADFSLVEGEIFDKKRKIREVWIGGKKHIVEAPLPFDPRGTWTLKLESGKVLTMEIKGKIKKLGGSLQREKEKGDSSGKKREKKGKKNIYSLSSIQVDYKSLSALFEGALFGEKGIGRLSALATPEGLLGRMTLRGGKEITFLGKRKKTEKKKAKKKAKKKKKKKKKKKDPSRPELSRQYPSGMYGFEKKPSQKEVILIKDSTVWTCGKKPQIIKGGDVLIVKGKIKKVALHIKAPPGAFVIDGRGKHVTPGLVDAHSHIAIERGVNEGSQADTSEVRIADVINPDSISIYRQLGGGTTTAHLMHGSANPIGGQTEVVKFRWGQGPEEMKLKGAFSLIKFALGENVKWKNRYPTSRMGVEQFYRDRFQAALDYRKKWQAYGKNPKGKIPPRKNLNLETLLEILDKKRKIHCHSYRQDGILMLIRVAEDYGFQIGTFQHVLEGYKVAEVMKKHGAHASTFSDWWAYKFEAYDAIPHNGALMHKVGVVVSFNSDSSELGRRMNLEAAKAIKYGGVSPAEALKFVTLNAAIQLGVEKRVGSLEAGKDGDFVIWSGSPLSTFSRCEQTWIEGRKYFDLALEKKLRKEAKRQKEKIIQYILKKGIKKKDKKK